MKKESLQTTTVRTLLAVLLFAGMGIIIVGGGCIIWEYQKDKPNKILPTFCKNNSDCPLQMKCENRICVEVGCLKESESLPRAINPKDINHIATKCCAGLKGITASKFYDADCNVQMFPLGGSTSICSNCGNGICESWENECNCPEDCERESDTSDWQTYRNEEFGFGIVFDEEYKNIWESKTIRYTNEDILARTDFYFKNHQTHIFSNIRIYDTKWFHKNSLIEENYSEEMQQGIIIAWKNKDKGLSNYLGIYLGKNDDYVFVLGVGPNGCNATESLCALSLLSGKMIINSFSIIKNNTNCISANCTIKKCIEAKGVKCVSEEGNYTPTLISKVKELQWKYPDFKCSWGCNKMRGDDCVISCSKK